MNDLRFAFRQLRKSPGFTFIAVLTLALGIGANTAIFSVIYAVLLRPLPYPEADRIQIVTESDPNQPQISVSFPDYVDWKRDNTVFEQLAISRRESFNLSGLQGRAPEQVSGAIVTANFFKVIGLEPQIGRVFTEEEDRVGGPLLAVIPLKSGRSFDARDGKNSKPAMMINETFARKYFPNQNPLGQRLNVGRSAADGEPPREIIGVAGTAKHNSLAETDEAEFYLAFAQVPDRYMDLVVRTREPAPAGLETMIRRAVHEIDSQQFVPTITPLSQLVSQTLAQTRFNRLLGAFAVVAIVLAAIGIYGVIAYNVTQRTKEIGIRMALGAQQRQMLTMILRPTIGIGVGLAGAFAATRLLTALLYGVGATDLPTYCAVILLLGCAAFLAALVPARRAMKVDPVIALRYE